MNDAMLYFVGGFGVGFWIAVALFLLGALKA